MVSGYGASRTAGLVGPTSGAAAAGTASIGSSEGIGSRRKAGRVVRPIRCGGRPVALGVACSGATRGGDAPSTKDRGGSPRPSPVAEGSSRTKLRGGDARPTVF